MSTVTFLTTDEKFTGESFLILKKDDFKELGITGFASKRLLEKLVEEACAQSSDSPPDSEAVDAATATVNSNTSTGEFELLLQVRLCPGFLLPPNIP